MINNTIEEKLRFFALHWGLQFTYKNSWGTFTDLIGNHNFISQASGISVLPLKSISLLSDEDAVKISDIAGIPSTYDDEKKAHEGKCLLNEYLNSSRCNVTPLNWLNIFEYLRSKGYALPWMGLTVEEMVIYKWIILTNN